MIMPKRKAPSRKKTVAEADSNGDATDSAVTFARTEPAPPPTKRSKIATAEKSKNNSAGQWTSHHTIY